MNIKDYLQQYEKIAYLKIKVVPKSVKNEFFNVMDDWTLKIRIKAVPEKWKANKELITFLAEELWVKKEQIKIISWIADQVKIIRVE